MIVVYGSDELVLRSLSWYLNSQTVVYDILPGRPGQWCYSFWLSLRLWFYQAALFVARHHLCHCGSLTQDTRWNSVESNYLCLHVHTVLTSFDSDRNSCIMSLSPMTRTEHTETCRQTERKTGYIYLYREVHFIARASITKSL